MIPTTQSKLTFAEELKRSAPVRFIAALKDFTADLKRVFPGAPFLLVYAERRQLEPLGTYLAMYRGVELTNEELLALMDGQQYDLVRTVLQTAVDRERLYRAWLRLKQEFDALRAGRYAQPNIAQAGQLERNSTRGGNPRDRGDSPVSRPLRKATAS